MYVIDCLCPCKVNALWNRKTSHVTQEWSNHSGIQDTFMPCSKVSFIFFQKWQTKCIRGKYIYILEFTAQFPGGSDGKSICLQCGRPGFDLWVGKIPWKRKRQPTSVLLPGKSHGQRSLAGYSPWGHKESDTTEWLHIIVNSQTVIHESCFQIWIHVLDFLFKSWKQLLRIMTTHFKPLLCKYLNYIQTWYWH